MKPFRIALATALMLLPALSPAQDRCRGTAVLARVEAPHGRLSLADLLSPGACQELRQAASEVELGAAPAPGVARTLEGSEVRRLLGEVSHRAKGIEFEPPEVPERIVVRHAGASKSCEEIRETVTQQFHARSQAGGESAIPPGLVENSRPGDFDCGGHRIPSPARLQLSKVYWDGALHSWEFLLDCLDRRDCIPFLVRFRDHGAAATPALVRPGRMVIVSSRSLASQTASAQSGALLVRPGETVTLRWEQAGIRLVLPVTCLDRGSLGESVRVRVKNGQYVLRAKVIGQGMLEAGL